MSSSKDFPRLNVIAIDENTKDPLEGVEVTVTAGNESQTERTVVNDMYEGVAAFEIAPMFDEVDVTLSHDMFEDQQAAVEIDDNIVTEPFKLSMDTGRVTLAGLEQFDVELDVKLIPEDEQLHELWDLADATVTIQPGENQSFRLPPGHYLMEIQPVNGVQLVSKPKQEIVVEAGVEDWQELTPRTVTELTDEQSEQVDRIRDIATLDDLDSDVDTAVQQYLMSVTDRLVTTLERELRDGLPQSVDGHPFKLVIDDYLDAVEETTVDARESLMSDGSIEMFRSRSTLPESDEEWGGQVSLEELDMLLSKDRDDAVASFDAIEASATGKLDEMRPQLDTLEPLLDVYQAVGEPDAEEEAPPRNSISGIITLYVRSRYWLAIEDLFDSRELRARFDDDITLSELHAPPSEDSESPENESGSEASSSDSATETGAGTSEEDAGMASEDEWTRPAESTGPLEQTDDELESVQEGSTDDEAPSEIATGDDSPPVANWDNDDSDGDTDTGADDTDEEDDDSGGLFGGS